MDYARHRTVAFSGHRTFKLGGEDAAHISVRAAQTIAGLHARGYDIFLCGMAEGFDMLAAREVLRMRDAGMAVTLVAVLPFSAQAARFTARAATLHGEILRAADHVELIFEDYRPECYHVRNDFLLDNASLLLCYYNGRPGGTQYTFRGAVKRGIATVNLFEAPQEGLLF